MGAIASPLFGLFVMGLCFRKSEYIVSSQSLLLIIHDIISVKYTNKISNISTLMLYSQGAIIGTLSGLTSVIIVCIGSTMVRSYGTSLPSTGTSGCSANNLTSSVVFENMTSPMPMILKQEALVKFHIIFYICIGRDNHIEIALKFKVIINFELTLEFISNFLSEFNIFINIIS